MSLIRVLSSMLLVVIVAGIVILLCAAVLVTFSQLGVIEFTGWAWLVNAIQLISGYLGYSVIFFVAALVGYARYFVLLKAVLFRIGSTLTTGGIENEDMENIKHYNGAIDIFITIFFAIGVLFTAWGLQHALVSALDGVSKAEAGRLGAWGILKRLVDNGILIALWTTIVGGAGGYIMRLLKYFFLGRDLNRISIRNEETEKANFLNALKAIGEYARKIEEKLETRSPTPDT